MIRLVYSDRAPRLVEALAEQIQAARSRPRYSPLDPVAVIVPDQATSAYLKMALAERLGIAANLQLDFLRSYLERLVHRAGGGAVLDGARLELILVDVLGRRATLESPELAPVARYLDAAAQDAAARDLRRTQLARLMARLYDEYVLTRPELLQRWSQPGFVPSSGVERWQRALWLALAEPLGAAGLRTLSEAFEAFEAPPDLPAQLHVWGVSVGGSVLQTVLARLSAHTELCLYTLNPCLEFWEDVRTGPDTSFLKDRLPPRAPAEIESLFGDDPFHLGRQSEDTPALRLWGRPGRENIRLLDELTDCDFDARFSDPGDAPETLLGSLQRDILLREPEREAPPPEAFANDASVSFTACASLRREVEAIAGRIWTLLQAPPAPGAPRLRFHDVAIALVGPDQDAYRAHIGAVFKERHDIPHTALDVPLSGSSRVVEAVELLLTLPRSDFRRQDLLRLVTHPVVISRYQDITADDWLAWCDALSVVHGADHRDHADTYISRDLYNWDQGLRRLVLGTFMSGRASGDDRRFDVAGQAYLPQEYPLEQLGAAAQLVVLVRSLIADARFAEQAAMPVTKWADYTRDLVSTYITPANEQDERDLVRVLSALQRLEELHPKGDEVSFDVAAELVRARLGALTHNRGQPLAEGVVVAPLALVAALPFRVVFMPGLGEGRFPAAERRNPLDLRGRERRAGDVSPRERDQYGFLERLIATQDSLHFSWVSRSAQTGDRLEPAPTLQELQTILQRGYLGAEGLERITAQQPLRRYAAPASADALEPEAALRERQVLGLRDDLAAHLGEPDELPELVDLRRGLPGETWREVSRRLRLAEPPASPGATRDRIEVPYRALRRFLEDPLQGWAEQVLLLREDDLEADPYATEDERFRTDRLDESRLLLDVFVAALEDPATPVEEVYRAEAELLELSGTMPTGVFQESERRRHLEVLEVWRTQLRRALQGRLQPVQQLRFGRAREHARVRGVADPIRIPLPDGRTVELLGSTDPLCETPAASFVARTTEPARGRARTMPELRSFLDHAVLAASGRRFEDGYRGFTAYGRAGPEGLSRVRYDPFTPAEAQAWLGELLVELLDEPHAYLLPFPTAVGVYEATGKGTSAIEEVLAQARPSLFGPLARAEVRPPSVDEAVHMVTRRFGPFWARREEEGS